MRERLLVAGIAAITAIWLGLLFSFSQSSFVALIAGTIAAAAVIWRWRAAAALAVLAVVLVSVGFATPQVRNELLQKSRAGLNSVTRWVVNGTSGTQRFPINGSAGLRRHRVVSI